MLTGAVSTCIQNTKSMGTVRALYCWEYEHVSPGAYVSERAAESLKAARIDLSPITKVTSFTKYILTTITEANRLMILSSVKLPKIGRKFIVALP